MSFEKQAFVSQFDENIKKAQSLKESFQKVAEYPEAVELFQHSMRLWQKTETAVYWWGRPSQSFQHISPLEYLAADPVKRAPEIEAALARIEHGVYF